MTLKSGLNPIVRVAAAGIGAACAGPLGAALGGWLGNALDGPMAELIKRYGEKFGEKAVETLFETGRDSLLERLKDPSLDLEVVYRKALHSSLAKIHARSGHMFDDWFENWNTCLAGTTYLDLPSLHAGQLAPEMHGEICFAPRWNA